MIPRLTKDGLLPRGRHAATMAELEACFVFGAPHPAERDLLWRAAATHMRVARQTLGPVTAWVDGGFVTHKAIAPKDVDVVYVLPGAQLDTAFVADAPRVLALLTLKDMIIGQPSAGWLDRLQPVGGLVDAFVAVEESAQQLSYWDGLWSSVKDHDGNIVDGAIKGYVEVRLP